MKTRLFALVISVAALWPATALAARCTIAPTGTLTVHFVAADSNNFGYVVHKVNGRWSLASNPCANPSGATVRAIEVTEDPGTAMHPEFRLSSITESGAIVPVAIRADGFGPNTTVDDLQIDGTPGTDDLTFNANGSILFGANRWIASDGLRRIRVDSGSGDDRLVGEDNPSLVRLYAGEGDDKLRGGARSDDLRGGPGADQFFGSGGGDYMAGEDGDDLFDTYAGRSRDVIDAGRGSDGISYADHDGPVIIQDQDAIKFGHGGALPAGPPGTEDIIGGFELILGSRFGDTIIGDEGPDSLQGLGGNDDVSGGAGTDRLFGGEGDDLLFGGDDGVQDVMNGGAGQNQCRRANAQDTMLNCALLTVLSEPRSTFAVALRGRRSQNGGRVRVSVRATEAANVKLSLVYTPRGRKSRALPPSFELLRANRRAVLTLPVPRKAGTVTVRAKAKRVGATARSKPLRVTVRP